MGCQGWAQPPGQRGGVWKFCLSLPHFAWRGVWGRDQQPCLQPWAGGCSQALQGKGPVEAGHRLTSLPQPPSPGHHPLSAPQGWRAGTLKAHFPPRPPTPVTIRDILVEQQQIKVVVVVGLIPPSRQPLPEEHRLPAQHRGISSPSPVPVPKWGGSPSRGAAATGQRQVEVQDGQHLLCGDHAPNVGQPMEQNFQADPGFQLSVRKVLSPGKAVIT